MFQSRTSRRSAGVLGETTFWDCAVNDVYNFDMYIQVWLWNNQNQSHYFKITDGPHPLQNSQLANQTSSHREPGPQCKVNIQLFLSQDLGLHFQLNVAWLLPSHDTVSCSPPQEPEDLSQLPADRTVHMWVIFHRLLCSAWPSKINTCSKSYNIFFGLTKCDSATESQGLKMQWGSHPIKAQPPVYRLCPCTVRIP